MAGDFTKPTVNSTYVNFPVEIRDMFADQAKMFDGVSTTNYPTGAIKWSDANSRWEKYNGSTWGVLKAKYLIDVDTVDGFHAGNANGNIPVSNGTVNTNLNADMVDGYNAGNGSGNIPISNGTVNTNLNADMLDGYHSSSFALLSGATFTSTVSISGTGRLLNIGDDAAFYDVNISHILGVYSQTDSNQGGIKLGATGPVINNNGSALLVSGDIQTYAPEIRCGTGQNEEKRVRLINANRDVYFALNGTAFNLYDVTGGLNRWTTDSGGNFAAAGNVTAYSDERLKKDFAPATVTLDQMLAIEPESFSRTDVELRQIGVRAQSIQRILPEAVQADKDGLLSLNYGAAAMVLTLNLAREVAALRAQVAV